MITLIVPTRNRAHTLRLVAPSFFEQGGVTEIIFVDDAGRDGTPDMIAQLAATHPDTRVLCIRNEERLGASQSRNVGSREAANDYILFCDDDIYLEPGYAQVCLDKLFTLGAGAVSGRCVYLEPGESMADALRRFGNGIRGTKPFRRLICEYVNAARFEGDIRLPITNAIILTRKSLLAKFPYDPHYARGNGYREESDFQMSLFVNGYDIYVTNERHSFHLPLSQVRTGGQRTRVLQRLYWSIYYTRYFFSKYYDRYARQVGLRSPRPLALAVFALFTLYRETLRPPLYLVAKWMIRQRQRLGALTTAAR